MSAQQPEALRLADALERRGFLGTTATEAAAELRRLHAEVERITAIADDLQALCDRQALRIAALEQPDTGIPASVLDDWKLVPVEPTQAMLRAAIDAPRPAVYVDSLSAAENLINTTKYRAMLDAAPQPPASKDPNWPKLEKPAQVGGGTFGIGTSSKHVVDAAQRAHDEHVRAGNLTHEQMVEEERKRRALWDMIHGSPEESKPQFVWQEQVAQQLSDIENPFNARMHQEHCKRWKAQASIQQGDHEPVAWLEPGGSRVCVNVAYEYTITEEHPRDLGWLPLCTHSQNLNCKSNQARLATLWGYVKPQPPRQPLTDEQIDTLEWSVPQPGEDGSYLAQRRNVRAIERAHGIGGEA